MENQVNENENYENNDGLGDLLKEREKLEFSWAKTSVVVGVLLAIIVITGVFIVKFGKNIVSKSSSNTNTAQVEESYINDRTKASDSNNSNQTASKSNKVTHAVSEKEPAPKPSINKTATLQKISYYKVITGTFKNKKYAQNLISKLKKSGFDGFYKTITSTTGARYYRVQSGSFLKKHQAETFKVKLSNSKFQSYIITE